MRALRAIFTLFVVLSCEANLIEFFSSGDSTCSSPTLRSWVFSDICTSYGGSYGLALTTCEGGGSGPLTVSLFFSGTGTLPPLCTGGAYAVFSAPVRGQCYPTSGVAAQFAGSFRIGGDSAPATCATTSTQSAFHLAVDSSSGSSCASPPTSYLTAPMRGNSCVPGSVQGFFASRAQASSSPPGVALQVFNGVAGDLCSNPQATWVTPPLPVDGTCVQAGSGSWVASALSSAAYSPVPPAPPPAIPGTGTTVQMYFNATDCDGPSFYVLSAYTGLCTAFVGLGVSLGACSVGASATVRLYNDTSANALSRATTPPSCTRGGAVREFETALVLGQCTEMLSNPEGGGKVFGRLLSARCQPTPPDSVFLTAHWLASATCTTTSSNGFNDPIWGTMEATLPCAQFNWLGTYQNSTTNLDLARGVVSQRVHYNSGEAQGCGGPALYDFIDVPLDGSECRASTVAFAGQAGVRVIPPGGGSLPPPSTPSFSPTPSFTPTASPSISQSPSPPPTPTPTPSMSSTPTPTLSSGASPSHTPSPTPSTSPTPSPPPSPTPSRTIGPSLAPSISATPTLSQPQAPQQQAQGQAQGALSPGAAAGVSIVVLIVLAGIATGAVWWWTGGTFSWATFNKGATSAAHLRRARASLADEAGGGGNSHPVLAQRGGGVAVTSPLWQTGQGAWYPQTTPPSALGHFRGSQGEGEK